MSVLEGGIMEKPLKTAVCIILAIGISLAASGCPQPQSKVSPGIPLPRFQSAEEFVSAFRDGPYPYGLMQDSALSWGWESAAAPGVKGSLNAGIARAGSPRYSTTNVQVEGVDEADTVKTDGEFIYVVSGKTLCIVKAYPPGEMALASRIDFGDAALPSELFVKGDRLAVIGSDYVGEPALPEGVTEEEGIYYTGRQLSFIRVYDISDRGNPRLLNTVEHEGAYLTSRMVGDDVHVVLNGWPPLAIYEKEDVKPEEIIPLCRTVRGEEEPGALVPACDWSEVEYFQPESCSSFLSILSLSLGDGGSAVEKREIAGNAACAYASPEHLYVAAVDYGRILPGDIRMDAASAIGTTIRKFRFEGASVGYLASCEVPGTILDQFSMDEWNGYFRVATTGYGTGGTFEPTNNLYVLDPSMNITGRLEGLAPGETIYSARFMEDRAYLVTFERIDPFFVLDLASPANPRVLGELKIPGYSDYLHPYDETHIIGVGMNAVEADPGQGNFSWFQGMKIALFDASDVSSPKEMHKVEIGDRGTDSYALHDHKAFLFDREKGLLVLPVLLAELTPEQKASGGTPPFEYGTPRFQGAYVYDLSLDGGFSLKGRITHVKDAGELAGGGPQYGGSSGFVTRSLFIGDSLYTISGSAIKANDLGTLEEQASISLGM